GKQSPLSRQHSTARSCESFTPGTLPRTRPGGQGRGLAGCPGGQPGAQERRPRSGGFRPNLFVAKERMFRAKPLVPLIAVASDPGRSSGALASLRLDIGRPDHLGPLFGFVRDELAEVGRRTLKWHPAELG